MHHVNIADMMEILLRTGVSLDALGVDPITARAALPFLLSYPDPLTFSEVKKITRLPKTTLLRRVSLFLEIDHLRAVSHRSGTAYVSTDQAIDLGFAIMEEAHRILSHQQSGFSPEIINRMRKSGYKPKQWASTIHWDPD